MGCEHRTAEWWWGRGNIYEKRLSRLAHPPARSLSLSLFLCLYRGVMRTDPRESNNIRIERYDIFFYAPLRPRVEEIVVVISLRCTRHDRRVRCVLRGCQMRLPLRQFRFTDRRGGLP